ncbi:dTMP kinase [Treponema bryantii]|uniref:dTMP kinase n=1 Tax=Treponema bryantii TaxID=163 RepID=UPI002B2C318B|nr:hypothetical protein TRBR_26830 [Treponema bryantii]
MSRGKLIVLCGIDGSGKTSVINELVKKDKIYTDYIQMKHPPKAWYENQRIAAAYLDQPGEKISDAEELIITHDLRKEEEKKEIIPLLRNNKNIIFHRYIFSLYAYHIGKENYSLDYLSKFYADILLPDKVIYLKISIDEFYRRFQKKEQLSYQKEKKYVENVMNCYETLAGLYNWSIIDTEKNDLNEVVRLVQKEIEQIVPTEDFYNLGKELYKE